MTCVSVRRLLAGALLALAATQAAAQAPWTVRDIGDLAVPGSQTTLLYVSGINEAGHIALRQVRSDTAETWSSIFVVRPDWTHLVASDPTRSSTSHRIAAINNHAGLVATLGAGYDTVIDYGNRRSSGPLPTLPGDAIAHALGLNDAGDAVGYSASVDGGVFRPRAVIFRSGQAPVQLPHLRAPAQGYAYAINDSGYIAGESVGASGWPRAVLWTEGSIRDLGTLGGVESRAYAVNSLGQAAGSSRTASGTAHAFLYQEGSMSDLGTLGGANSIALAVNDLGQVAGASERAGQPGWFPFLWEAGRMTDLGALPEVAALGCTSWALSPELVREGDGVGLGLNNRGQIALACQSASGAPRVLVLSRDRPYAPGPLDFDGDRRSDLLWQHADGRAAVWQMNGTTPVASSGILSAGTGWIASHIADFDGDGKADILWRHPDGGLALYLMDGSQVVMARQLLGSGTGWRVVQVADLDRDGKADLVFEHASGAIAAWLMEGVDVKAGATLLNAGSGWHVSQAADFDADGRADILWVHDDGRVAMWLMDGLRMTASQELLGAGSGWKPTHARDLDFDLRADILWQHTDGAVAYWLMDGTRRVDSRTLLGPGSGWSITHVGRFQSYWGMGLVWSHTDGSVSLWILARDTNGLVRYGESIGLRGAGTGWRVRQLGRMDDRSYDDLVWEHADGRSEAWLLEDGAVTSRGALLGAGSGWSVVN